jgi:hypothetical protein
MAIQRELFDPPAPRASGVTLDHIQRVSADILSARGGRGRVPLRALRGRGPA